jgi:ribosomal protein S18 acetylase RimI-like enzyme
MTTPGAQLLHTVRPLKAVSKPGAFAHVETRLAFRLVKRSTSWDRRIAHQKHSQNANDFVNARGAEMMPPTIRPARPGEYDEIARVWMNSWVSTGLEEASNFLLANLRARISSEIEKGWSLFVADDNGKLAAMLALHLPSLYLDMLFVAPEYQGKNLGRTLLAFTREHLPDEICLRCVRENERAWRWYERERFVFEKEAVEPMTGFVMKYYRWKKPGPVK